MPTIWTDSMERALLAIATANPEASERELAAQLTETFGVPVTGNMARNKLKRLREELELEASAPSIPGDQLVVPNAPKDEFVGFTMGYYDIETTDLKAFMGRVLGISIADAWGNITRRTYRDFAGKTILDDSGLVAWAKEELEKYDIIVSWNGKLFDKPFINARLMQGLQLPVRQDKMHVDLMYYAGGQFMRIGSRKLVNVQKFLKVPNAKTEISWDDWAKAAAGDEAALEEVMSHCDADVLVLRDVFARLKPLITIVHR